MALNERRLEENEVITTGCWLIDDYRKVDSVDRAAYSPAPTDRAQTGWRHRHTELKNPFRGTKARPPKKPARKLAVPSNREIEVLEAAAEPVLRAAIAYMSDMGLRVGALPALSINSERWTTTTKGKDHAGQITAEVRRAIRRASLPLRSPFKAPTAGAVAKRFEYLARKLHAAGEIRAHYSVHDLRHAFAVRTYQETRDVYSVKTALGHANVAVTETYLRSIGAVD